MAGTSFEYDLSGPGKSFLKRTMKGEAFVVVCNRTSTVTIRLAGELSRGGVKQEAGGKGGVPSPAKAARLKAAAVPALAGVVRVVPSVEESAPAAACLWKDIVTYACGTLGWSWSNTLLQHWATSGLRPSLADIPMLIRSAGPNRLARARLGFCNDWLSSVAYVATSDGLMERGVPEPIAVALGTAASCLVTVPSGNIMQQLKGGAKSGVVGATKTMIQQQGVRSVFQGLGQMVATSAPTITIMVCTYMTLKNRVEREQGGKNIDGQRAAVAGGFAGAASVASMSALTVGGRSVAHAVRHKRRLQEAFRSQATPQAIRTLGSSMLVEAATSAVFFMVYEMVHVVIYNKLQKEAAEKPKVPGGRTGLRVSVNGLLQSMAVPSSLARSPVRPSRAVFTPAFARIKGSPFKEPGKERRAKK